MAFVFASRLWVAPVNVKGVMSAPPRALNTEVTDAPTWSGDSASLLYLCNGTLRRIGATGGKPATVPHGITWANAKPTGRVVVRGGRVWQGLTPEARTNTDVVIVGNRIADLVDARCLLVAGLADLPDHRGDPLHPADDVVHRHARALHQLRAGFHPLDAVVDQGLDLARRIGAALGQAAHLAGHHGKATALLARAGCFHGGIQRQNIGLEGNAVDDGNDVGNLARRVVDLPHGRHGLVHHSAAGIHQCAGTLAQAGGLLHGFGALRRGVRHFFHGAGGGLQLGTTLLRAAAQILVAGGDLGRGIAHLPGTLVERTQHGTDADLQRLHGAQSFAQRGVAKAGGHIARQVTMPHAISARDQLFHKVLAGHGAVQVQPQHKQAHTQAAEDQSHLAPVHQNTGDDHHLQGDIEQQLNGYALLEGELIEHAACLLGYGANLADCIETEHRDCAISTAGAQRSLTKWSPKKNWRVTSE